VALSVASSRGGRWRWLRSLLAITLLKGTESLGDGLACLEMRVSSSGSASDTSQEETAAEESEFVGYDCVVLGAVVDVEVVESAGTGAVPRVARLRSLVRVWRLDR